MIIDVHNHPDWGGYTMKKIIENMDKNHIDKTWILSWECPADEYDPSYLPGTPDPDFADGPISFRRCAEYVQNAPERFIAGYAPDPRRPNAIERLKRMMGLYGVKVYGELKLRMMYDDWDAVRLYRFCGENGLPVVVHIDYEIPWEKGYYPRPNWWYGGGIEAFERAVAACPETFFIGHAPGFWAHISNDDKYLTIAYPEGKVAPGGKLPDMLRRYKNLYCDISANSGLNAFKRDPAFAAEFIDEFQDRILYGRDSMENNHQEFINGMALPASVTDKIYYKNAIKLIG